MKTDYHISMAASDALKKAQKFNDIPHVVEAIERASMLINLSPQQAEEIFRKKLKEYETKI
ncbi:Uncharacterised protein [uncultured archaeon]|nr:Uncharacterised protein [uncultured archaeon]